MAIAAAASAMVDFNDLAAQAGAAPPVVAYLRARGVDRTSTLALIALDVEALQKSIIQDYVDGIDIAGVTHKADPIHADVARAIIIHMWSEARRQWTIHTAIPAPPAAAAQPPAQASASQAPHNARVDEKPPKTFSAWQTQVESYNARLLDGERRRFPTQALLGAEEVLARMWHEHTVTKSYTPVSLSEILARRTYQASGEINPYAIRRAASATEEKDWVPRTLLAVIDGADSVSGLGPWPDRALRDRHIRRLPWFVAKARSRPGMMEQVVDFWSAIGWTLAMDLRLGKSFAEATKEIMENHALFYDAMAKPPKAPPKTGKSEPWPCPTWSA